LFPPIEVVPLKWQKTRKKSVPRLQVWAIGMRFPSSLNRDFAVARRVLWFCGGGAGETFFGRTGRGWGRHCRFVLSPIWIREFVGWAPSSSRSTTNMASAERRKVLPLCLRPICPFFGRGSHKVALKTGPISQGYNSGFRDTPNPRRSNHPPRPASRPRQSRDFLECCVGTFFAGFFPFYVLWRPVPWAFVVNRGKRL